MDRVRKNRNGIHSPRIHPSQEGKKQRQETGGQRKAGEVRINKADATDGGQMRSWDFNISEMVLF